MAAEEFDADTFDADAFERKMITELAEGFLQYRKRHSKAGLRLVRWHRKYFVASNARSELAYGKAADTPPDKRKRVAFADIRSVDADPGEATFRLEAETADEDDVVTFEFKAADAGEAARWVTALRQAREHGSGGQRRAPSLTEARTKAKMLQAARQSQLAAPMAGPAPPPEPAPGGCGCFGWCSPPPPGHHQVARV